MGIEWGRFDDFYEERPEQQFGRLRLSVLWKWLPEILRELAADYKKTIGGLQKAIGGVRKNIGGVRKIVSGLRKIIGGLRKTIGGLRKIVGGVGWHKMEQVY